MSDIKNIIENARKADAAYDIAGEVSADTWAELRAVGANVYGGVEEFIATLAPHEDEFMEEYFSDEPLAKKKNGEWKYRAFKDENGQQVYTLPKDYVSAKSVVKGCLEQGVDLHLDMGKTEAQNKIKAAKQESNPTTPMDRCRKACATISANWDSLSTEEKKNIKAFVYDL
jgi:hypothetical protein